MKAFLNFKNDSSLAMTRNGVTFNFVPVTMEKGSKGVFPGIDAKSFDLEKFITFQCKNIETANDTVMRTNAFNTFIVECLNEVTMAIWKDCVASTEVEYKPSKTGKKPEINVSDETYATYVKAFTDSLEDYFSLVTKAREKNSVYYKKLAADLAKSYSKETDKEKKAILLAQAREAQKTAKTLEEQENKALDNALLDILGDDVLNDSTDSTTPAESKPEETKSEVPVGNKVADAIKEAIEKQQTESKQSTK